MELSHFCRLKAEAAERRRTLAVDPADALHHDDVAQWWRTLESEAREIEAEATSNANVSPNDIKINRAAAGPPN